MASVSEDRVRLLQVLRTRLLREKLLAQSDQKRSLMSPPGQRDQAATPPMSGGWDSQTTSGFSALHSSPPPKRVRITVTDNSGTVIRSHNQTRKLAKKLRKQEQQRPRPQPPARLRSVIVRVDPDSDEEEEEAPLDQASSIQATGDRPSRGESLESWTDDDQDDDAGDDGEELLDHEGEAAHR